MADSPLPALDQLELAVKEELETSKSESSADSEPCLKVKTRRRRPSGKTFKCTFCGHTFNQIGNFKNHQMLHTGERPYKCTHCEKGFIEARTLERHIMSHTGVRPFTCAHCPKSFKEALKLKRHILTMHTTDRPHKCSYCHNAYACRYELNAHLRTHEGTSKRHFCSICQNGFTTHATLRRHLRQVHNGETRKILIYNKESKTTEAVRHYCSICPKSYSYPSDLTLHMKTHTDPQRFSCFHCGKVYDMEKKLKIHLKSHASKADIAEQSGKQKRKQGGGEVVNLLQPIKEELKGLDELLPSSENKDLLGPLLSVKGMTRERAVYVCGTIAPLSPRSTTTAKRNKHQLKRKKTFAVVPPKQKRFTNNEAGISSLQTKLLKLGDESDLVDINKNMVVHETATHFKYSSCPRCVDGFQIEHDLVKHLQSH